MYKLEFMFIPNGFDNIFGGGQQTFTLFSTVSPQKNNETLFQSLYVDCGSYQRNTLKSFRKFQYMLYIYIMLSVIVPFS